MLLQGCVKTVSLSSQEYGVDHLLMPVFPTRNGLPNLESIEFKQARQKRWRKLAYGRTGKNALNAVDAFGDFSNEQIERCWIPQTSQQVRDRFCSLHPLQVKGSWCPFEHPAPAEMIRHDKCSLLAVRMDGISPQGRY